MNRAVAAFEKGRFVESAAAFDALSKAVPDRFERQGRSMHMVARVHARRS